ncbi:MAG: peroxiredoxin [Lentimicrobiaceae bacterium]|jgi:peroxiredoxin (alkyl hydroperoxide reductase subunit C)
MKKLILVAVAFFAMAQLWAQSDAKKSVVNSRIPLLGEDAPAFTAESTKGTIEFPSDYGRKWKVLCSHPGDFTPVCTSELTELALMQQDFKDLNVALVVVSTDNLERHKLWVKSMEDILLTTKNESVKINFPLVDDSKLNIGWEYGMITPDVNSRHAVRGVFIIDPKNKIRAISFYPSQVGRNMDEIKRTVIALQTADKNTVMTPANWEPGGDVLLPYPESVDYYDPNKVKPSGLYDIAGYMLYKKLDKK